MKPEGHLFLTVTWFYTAPDRVQLVVLFWIVNVAAVAWAGHPEEGGYYKMFFKAVLQPLIFQLRDDHLGVSCLMMRQEGFISRGK